MKRAWGRASGWEEFGVGPREGVGLELEGSEGKANKGMGLVGSVVGGFCSGEVLGPQGSW